MPFVIPNLVIAAGLFLLSSLLTKRPKGVSPYSFNDLDLSTSRIGQPINFVIGTAKISPNIVYYGDFIANPNRKRTGLFGPKTTVSYDYYLSVQEVLCHGPIERIEAVYNGEDQTSFTPSRINAVTGFDTTIGFNGKSCNMYIRAGNNDQTIIPQLLNKITPQTSYPNIAHVYYERGYMGQGLSWPNLSYIVTRYPKTEISSEVPVKIVGDNGNVGVNPVHAILDLLTNPILGPILRKDQIDITSLIDIGKIFKDEKIFVNFAITQSNTVKDLLGILFTDLGILCFERKGLLTFRLLRSNNNITKVISNTTASLLTQTPDINVNLNTDKSNYKIYEFQDYSLNYRINTLIDLDMGNLKLLNQITAENKQISYINDSLVAQKIVALNKSFTNNGLENTEFTIPDKDLYLEPGFIVKTSRNGKTKNWRVLRTELDNDELKVSVIKDTIRNINLNFNDNINFQTTSIILAPINGLGIGDTTQPEMTLMEIPWEINLSERPGIFAIAIKPNQSIINNNYMISNNATTNYILQEFSPLFSKGLKVVSTDTTYCYLNIINNDDPITELSVTDAEWENNKIYTFVDNEIISVKSLTQGNTTLGYDYRIAFTHMIRGVMSTEIADITTDMILFFGNEVDLGYHPYFEGTFYVKPLTQTSKESLPESSTDALIYTTLGTAAGPLAPEKLAGFRTSSSCYFKWNSYEKSDSGKKTPTTTPTYDTLYSYDDVNYSTVPSPYTHLWVTNAATFTLYLKTRKNGRTSFRRFYQI